MPASGYLAPRPAGQAPAGPAITTLTAVVTRSTELRARGLTVHVDRPGLVPALAGGAGRLGPEWPEVPVPVATALAHAVREALASVAVLEAEARPLLRGVADATLAAVEEVVRARPPHPVTLTVLASGDDVELYVAFARPPARPPEVSGLSGSVPAAEGWRAAVDVDQTGAGCLEVRWRKQEAA